MTFEERVKEEIARQQIVKTDADLSNEHLSKVKDEINDKAMDVIESWNVLLKPFHKAAFFSDEVLSVLNGPGNFITPAEKEGIVTYEYRFKLDKYNDGSFILEIKLMDDTGANKEPVLSIELYSDNCTADVNHPQGQSGIEDVYLNIIANTETIKEYIKTILFDGLADSTRHMLNSAFENKANTNRLARTMQSL